MAGCNPGYRPVSEWEQQNFRKAERPVYPNMVIKNPARFQNTVVAWPGIIETAEIYENPGNFQVVLRMEHHYYNWQEDPDPNGIIYHLSRQGEGFFQTNWFIKKEAGMDFIEERFAPGNLAFVYGVPDTVVDNEVILEGLYVRTVPPEAYEADFFNYIPKNSTSAGEQVR
ncbi:MAG: hypothetical protein WAN36_15500 [Calditrichia bacterium]